MSEPDGPVRPGYIGPWKVTFRIRPNNPNETDPQGEAHAQHDPKHDPEGGADRYLVEDMAENEGPVVDFCRYRILDQLSSTDDHLATHRRDRCRERVTRKRWDAAVFDELGRLAGKPGVRPCASGSRTFGGFTPALDRQIVIHAGHNNKTCNRTT
jgi:hypothetical protein